MKLLLLALVFITGTVLAQVDHWNYIKPDEKELIERIDADYLIIKDFHRRVHIGEYRTYLSGRLREVIIAANPNPMQSMQMSFAVSSEPAVRPIDLYYIWPSSTGQNQIIKNIQGTAEVIYTHTDNRTNIHGIALAPDGSLYGGFTEWTSTGIDYVVRKIYFDTVFSEYRIKEIHRVSNNHQMWINSFSLKVLANKQVQIVFVTHKMVNETLINTLHRGTTDGSRFIESYSKEFTSPGFIAGVEQNSAGDVFYALNTYNSDTDTWKSEIIKLSGTANVSIHTTVGDTVFQGVGTPLAIKENEMSFAATHMDTGYDIFKWQYLESSSKPVLFKKYRSGEPEVFCGWGPDYVLGSIQYGKSGKLFHEVLVRDFYFSEEPEFAECEYHRFDILRDDDVVETYEEDRELSMGISSQGIIFLDNDKKLGLIRVAQATFHPEDVEKVNLTANKDSVVEVNIQEVDSLIGNTVSLRLEFKNKVDDQVLWNEVQENEYLLNDLLEPVNQGSKKFIRFNISTQELFGNVAGNDLRKDIVISVYADVLGEEHLVDSIEASVYLIPPKILYAGIIDCIDDNLCGQGSKVSLTDLNSFTESASWASLSLPFSRLSYNTAFATAEGKVNASSEMQECRMVGEKFVCEGYGIFKDMFSLYKAFRDSPLVDTKEGIVMGIVNENYFSFKDNIVNPEDPTYGMAPVTPLGTADPCIAINLSFPNKIFLISKPAFAYKGVIQHEIMHMLGINHTTHKDGDDSANDHFFADPVIGGIKIGESSIQRIHDAIDTLHPFVLTSGSPWVKYKDYNTSVCRLSNRLIDPKIVGFVGVIGRDGLFVEVSTKIFEDGFIAQGDNDSPYELRAIDSSGNILSSYRYTPSFVFSQFKGGSESLEPYQEFFDVDYFPIYVNLEVTDDVVEIQALKEGVVLQSFLPDTEAVVDFSYEKSVSLIPRNAFLERDKKDQVLCKECYLKVLNHAINVDKLLLELNIALIKDYKTTNEEKVFQLKKNLIVRAQVALIHFQQEIKKEVQPYETTNGLLAKEELLSLIQADIIKLKQLLINHNRGK